MKHYNQSFKAAPKTPVAKPIINPAFINPIYEINRSFPAAPDQRQPYPFSQTDKTVSIPVRSSNFSSMFPTGNQQNNFAPPITAPTRNAPTQIPAFYPPTTATAITKNVVVPTATALPPKPTTIPATMFVPTNTKAPVVANTATPKAGVTPEPTKIVSDNNNIIGQWGNLIQEASEKFGVPASLIASIIKNESNGNTYAESYAGAQGLMQLMPDTAKQLAQQIGMPPNFDIFHPPTNIALGSEYIRQMQNMFGEDFYKIAGAYNSGAYTNSRDGTTLDQRINEKDKLEGYAPTIKYANNVVNWEKFFLRQLTDYKNKDNRDDLDYPIAFEGVPRKKQEVVSTATASVSAQPTAEAIQTTSPKLPASFTGVDLVPSTLAGINGKTSTYINRNADNAIMAAKREFNLTASGVGIAVHEGYRSFEDQGKLSSAVTSAGPGDSQHQSGFAFDIYFIAPNGKVLVDSSNFTAEEARIVSESHKRWEQIAVKHGITKPLSWDTPHYVATQPLFDAAIGILQNKNVSPDLLNALQQKIRDGVITNNEINWILNTSFGLQK